MDSTNPTQRLTEREKEVLQALCQHPTLNQEDVAIIVSMAHGTFRHHLSNIRIKLNANTTSDLIENHCRKIEDVEEFPPHRELLENNISEQAYLENLSPLESTVQAEGQRQANRAKIGQLWKLAYLIIGLGILGVLLSWMWIQRRPLIQMACDNVTLSADIFVQLSTIGTQRPFYDKDHANVFECEGQASVVHSPPAALKVSYHGQENSDYGFVGIGSLNGFDVSKYEELCFWVYVEQPRQAFWLNLKDMTMKSGEDARQLIIIDTINTWHERCVALDDYKEYVDLRQLENVNLGFDNGTGEIIAWFDDFAFK